MKIVIRQTDITSVDMMLSAWQKGRQWGMANDTEKELWRENAAGIRTSATSQKIYQVYNEATGIVYLIACLRDWRGAITVSEVVSNPQVSMEKESASEAGKVYLHWVSKQSPNLDKQGIGCLFSWAASISTKPLSLTANTMGLIKLYGSYGFEVVPPSKPGVSKYLESPEAKMKYSKIDQNMKLSEAGKSILCSKYASGRDWILFGT